MFYEGVWCLCYGINIFINPQGRAKENVNRSFKVRTKNRIILFVIMINKFTIRACEVKQIILSL